MKTKNSLRKDVLLFFKWSVVGLALGVSVVGSGFFAANKKLAQHLTSGKTL